MKIYTLTSSINQSMSPTLETQYFTDKDLSIQKFNDLVEYVGDDYQTISLECFDTKTKKVELIKSWEGNMDDLPEEEDEEDS